MQRNTPGEQIEQIKNSILKFGNNDPIAVWGDNNIIVEGHGRYTALQQLGYEEVECIRLDHLSEEERRAYTLAHNKLTMNTGFDMDVLTAELEQLQEMDFDLSLTGFNMDELDSLLETEEEPEVTEDEYEVELPEEPRAKLGDIYQLGRHRLMCGSALYIDDVNRLLNGEYCELTFTDPPYELDTKGGGVFKNVNSMKQVKENGVDKFNPSELVVFSDTNIYCHNKPLIKKYIELAEENKMHYDLCFYKKLCTIPNYKGHMMTDCEYIAIIGNQNPNKGLEKEMYSKCYVGKKDSDNKLSYSKPIELCAKFIKLYSKSNVLDLFGGSGSTLIACEQLNRTCYMMELNPKYVDVIIDRWETLTGEKAELIDKLGE